MITSSSAVRDTDLAAAYAHCRAIAKAQAKNFYYAFRVLPQHKSDAMCAVYAFMRKADDLADDESLSIEQRRAAMAEWTRALHVSRTGPTDDLVLLALRDVQRRFGIPDELLDQLVQGTTMDLQDSLPGIEEVAVTVTGDPGTHITHVYRYDTYRTFDDLYRYCYLVASVVGLVCIRIFGYRDPAAEKLAEETGVAFQLTNILRDISEDAQRYRIYLPLDDIHAANTSVEELRLAVQKRAPSAGLLMLQQQEIDRAENYYRAAERLIPLLDADSQPAMRVLADIYHGLLKRIAADPAAVFRGRVSVPTATKLAILGRGLLASALAKGE